MKKLLTATAAVAFLGVSSLAAFADEVTGSITSIDVTNGTMTLDNGQTYQVAPQQKMDLAASNATPVVLASFRSGDRVVIRFEVFGEDLMASSVAPAQR